MQESTAIADTQSSHLQWEEVVLVPDPPFFWRSVDLPEGLKDSELAEFLEVTLEQWSPFPLHQIFWGHYRPAGARRVLLFAAYRKRIEDLVGDSLEEADLVAPAVCSVLGMGEEKEKRLLLRFGEGLTLVVWDSGEPVPRLVQSRQIPEEEEDLFPEEIIQALYRKAGVSRYTEREEKRTAPAFLGWDKSAAVFRFLAPEGEEEGNEAVHKTALRREEATGLDIREQEFLDSRRLQQRRSALYLRAFWVLLLGLGALLAGEIAGQFFQWQIEQRQEKVEARQATVSKIQEQENFAERMAEIAANQLLPFSMLELVNRLRPSSITFTRAEIGGDLRMEVVAETGNSEDVIRFETALEEAPQIRSVEIINQTLREGRTNFRMRLVFASEPFMEFVRVPEEALLEIARGEEELPPRPVE